MASRPLPGRLHAHNPEERLGADKQQRPAGSNGLTKRSGPSISHESLSDSDGRPTTNDHGNWDPKTRVRTPCKALSQKFFDPLLPPSLVIKKERQKKTQGRAASPTWCYSRETPSLVPTLTGSPNFASIPAAKPILRPSRLVHHSPRCSVLFSPIHPCAPTLHNVTLPGFATDGRATLAYTVQPHHFLCVLACHGRGVLIDRFGFTVFYFPSLMFIAFSCFFF
ncbi:hypothetical protein F5144DRAFT_260604 [Chaetomium tenue]|uniref:Uncharacterized protein n=1 Tax=Chaetomium tenue TaxID=1854479 RepID=A0ACB7P9W7_9PEZI|nr:hypothetical protein F5144DRAFT_260604 [Chaetomium globosum]